MKEPPGGRAAAEADQVTRFTAETVVAREARALAWVFIALGIGSILFGGIFFAVQHTGHDIVAIVTHEGPCSNGTCTVHVSYDAGDREVLAVMHGVPRGEVYGSPWPRLNITYPASDLPDAIWIVSWAVGLACVGSGVWLRRRTRRQQKLTEAAVVTGMTPQQQARYALDSGLPREDLPEAVRAAYDRVRAERQRAQVRARKAGELPPLGPFRPSRRRPMNDSGPAGRRVARSTTPVTFRFGPGRGLGGLALGLILGIPLAIVPITQTAVLSGASIWGKIAFIGVFAVGAAGGIWLGISLFRAGVQIRGEQVVIRDSVRTRKLNASQIRDITLEPVVRPSIDGDANFWTPSFHLTDGSSIRLKIGQTTKLDRPAPERMQRIVKDIRWHLGIDGKYSQRG